MSQTLSELSKFDCKSLDVFSVDTTIDFSTSSPLCKNEDVHSMGIIEDLENWVLWI